VPLSQQVNAVSRTRFLKMGRNTETHNEKNIRWIAHVARSANATYRGKPKLISLVALANRNAKAGGKANPGTD
jgi:hypothetical protein